MKKNLLELKPCPKGHTEVGTTKLLGNKLWGVECFHVDCFCLKAAYTSKMAAINSWNTRSVKTNGR